MKFLFGNTAYSNYLPGSVATIGNFDGVHRGHQAILTALNQKARAYNLPSVVILFEPQPNEYFLQKKAPARLTSLREKLSIIAQFEIDHVLALRFNEQLAQMSPETFAQDIIFGRFQTQCLFVGGDFRFGHQRKGDLQLLASLGRERACELIVFPEVTFEGERVSSTAIRQALAQRDLERAQQLLGRPFAISGRVLRGQGIGRQWGVPTANIHMNRSNPPLSGIFCVRVQRENGAYFNGVASLGTRPTMGRDGAMILEVHLFDFTGDLYGERLQVLFLHALREERFFPTMDELIKQIFIDIDNATLYFNEE